MNELPENDDKSTDENADNYSDSENEHDVYRFRSFETLSNSYYLENANNKRQRSLCWQIFVKYKITGRRRYFLESKIFLKTAVLRFYFFK